MDNLRIKLQYYGAIREIVGKPEEEKNLDKEVPVLDFLRNITYDYGSKLHEEIFDLATNDVRKDVMLMLNGITLGREKLPNTLLKPGDELALLPTFPGGGF
ncbi:MAG: MoaD/ThiS family protein [Eubacteriaceae bacterium]|nr:MoaD/ThiS family protein [Eubacteriaceae bacterium]